MRDDSQRWAPPRDRILDIVVPGVTIKAINLPRLTLLSGPRVLQKAALPLVGWPEVATAESYAICLRRDRVLEVNGPERQEGWDSETDLAVSDVTDAYAQMDITGVSAVSLLNRGTELDLGTPSRSVSRLLFGFGAFIYRFGDENSYRLHVASSHDEALWHALKDAARHLT